MPRSGMRTSPIGTCGAHLGWMMKTRTGSPLAPDRNRRQLTHPEPLFEHWKHAYTVCRERQETNATAALVSSHARCPEASRPGAVKRAQSSNPIKNLGHAVRLG